MAYLDEDTEYEVVDLYDFSTNYHLVVNTVSTVDMCDVLFIIVVNSLPKYL